jgi:hypothetical protein
VPPLHEAIGQTKNLVRAVGTEMGVVFTEPPGVYLVDEQAKEFPSTRHCCLPAVIGSDGRRGQSRSDHGREPVDQPRDGSDLGDPAPATPPTRRRRLPGRRRSRALGGGYVSWFCPRFDAVASGASS